ncbi:ABC transporter ATP-binding protein [Glutamicibacter sp. PS]|uniref:ABC transporter ATP-binding protein n=1 Tax=Glutamicibacter sp. PS TaxID=3075634 RepID=UPI00283AFA15|nr:ABC transporter ATP-binding protein [Glutamicibacter sp. PS]MDR4533891.1 ABC transporter ATP-binding protein [Glutamicibacter sp. PS]
MLVADQITVAGRHGQLVDPTSLQVKLGELLVVQAGTQISRTALSLVLSGRMAPSTGSVAWNHSNKLASLRKHSALVDSPEINAPEQHLKVRDLVAEDLSLVPVPLWRKRSIDDWLDRNGFREVANEWLDSLDPLIRLQIMARLAAEYHEVRLAVFDSPERHGLDDADWLELLEGIAQDDETFAVVAVVSRIPDCWQGPAVIMGQPEPVLEMALPSEEPAAATEAIVLPPTPTPEAPPAATPAPVDATDDNVEPPQNLEVEQEQVADGESAEQVTTPLPAAPDQPSETTRAKDNS